jgi:hypothetical protein
MSISAGAEPRHNGRILTTPISTALRVSFLIAVELFEQMKAAGKLGHEIMIWHGRRRV